MKRYLQELTCTIPASPQSFVMQKRTITVPSRKDHSLRLVSNLTRLGLTKKENMCLLESCHPSYTDKILSRLTVWAPNGRQSEM